MNRISLLLLIVFSFFSTACITPVRPVVVLGQPGVIYRSPNQNARGNSITVTVVNNIAGAQVDVFVDQTMVIQGLKPGVPEVVTFMCGGQGLVNISLGGNRRRGNTNQAFTLTAAVSQDSTYLGLAQGGRRVNLNCQNGNQRAQQQALQWEIRTVQPPQVPRRTAS